MTYKEAILAKYPDHPNLRDFDEDSVWWKQQIVAVYRETTSKGTAFWQSYEGLPALEDVVQ